ncbi:unnamed protein product [Effrenium voratum]|uniref:Uncharacterized protein n=1 Tax=Effrenium voratum TaxID=2562239 RepID=A0AA36MZN6_9DINO|nr:unnamed protein product [Effrenium voratum]
MAARPLDFGDVLRLVEQYGSLEPELSERSERGQGGGNSAAGPAEGAAGCRRGRGRKRAAAGQAEEAGDAEAEEAEGEAEQAAGGPGEAAAARRGRRPALRRLAVGPRRQQQAQNAVRRRGQAAEQLKQKQLALQGKSFNKSGRARTSDHRMPGRDLGRAQAAGRGAWKTWTPEAVLRAGFGSESATARQIAKEVEGASAAQALMARQTCAAAVLSAQQEGCERLVEKSRNEPISFFIRNLMFDESTFDLKVLAPMNSATMWKTLSDHAGGAGACSVCADHTCTVTTSDAHAANIKMLKHLDSAQSPDQLLQLLQAEPAGVQAEWSRARSQTRQFLALCSMFEASAQDDAGHDGEDEGLRPGLAELESFFNGPGFAMADMDVDSAAGGPLAGQGSGPQAGLTDPPRGSNTAFADWAKSVAPADARYGLLRKFDSLASAVAEESLRELRSTLVSDSYGGARAADVIFRARESYNMKRPALHPMHLALRTPEGGELWIGGLNAGGNAELLRVNGISAVLCAGSNVSAARAAFIKNIGTFDGTGVCRGSIKWATVLSVLRTVAKELAAGGRVLVVCKNGAHRSALWLALLLCVLRCSTWEICDFDTYHPGHHRFQSHWEAPVRTPAQFLEAT